ncbi:hypothetical protein, partial [Desulfovibrio inopinatus]|uniref:hypothetical protein n=1 Tax=Desulfovibrio inopinatus TaxID=102109 RepID=UPI00048508D1
MFRNVVRRETAIPALVATLLFCLCLTNTAHSFSFTWHENYLACARRCQTADQSAPEEIRKSCIVNCNFEADRAHMYPSPYYPTGPALAGDDPILPIYRQCLDTCGDKDGPHARAACYRACNKTLQDGGFIAAAEATMQAQDEPAAAPADGQPAVTEEAQGTDAVAEEAAHQEEAIEHEAAEAQDE